jgi:hypothetical protein
MQRDIGIKVAQYHRPGNDVRCIFGQKVERFSFIC